MPDNVKERILAVSRQHPDYGARRLLPLLKQDDISVSASTIYNILKRNGLETRTKRLSKIEAPGKERGFAFRKTPTKITPELDAQIVSVCLQHADFSARRLVPILKEQEISVSESTVYKILKSHGIQTHALRLLKLKEQEPADIPFPAEPAEQVLQDAVEEKEPSPKPPLEKTPAVPAKRGYWLFHLLNLLLLVLVGYLGFYAIQHFPKAGEEPEAVSTTALKPVNNAPVSDTIARPLQDYRVIWERNLFNIKGESEQEPENKISLENIAAADKDIGLKLVGTVVADDTALSRAVINNQKTREQKAYLEGDQAGEVKIKKILRNNVIITTENGDELLTIDPEDSGKDRKASKPERYASLSLSPTHQSVEDRPSTVRRSGRSLSRENVIAALEDFDVILQNVQISPYEENNESIGMKISGFASKSIFRKMGLRNGDVIMAVNNEATTDPEHISRLFVELMERDDLTIKIKRRRRNRTLRLNIE